MKNESKYFCGVITAFFGFPMAAVLFLVAFNLDMSAFPFGVLFTAVGLVGSAVAYVYREYEDTDLS